MNDFWNDYPSIKQDLIKVNDHMLDLFHKGHPVVREALTDLAKSDGKMLRAGVFIICSKFGNLEFDKCLRLGAAIEMLHLATLIHDDVIDNSELRRGRPTIHTSHGKRNAVLMGDYLFSQCFILVSDFAKAENIRALSHALSSLCVSELNQSAQLFRKSTSVRQYLRRIIGKTAALFSISCYAGGLESGCSKIFSSIMEKAGYNIGIGFQIIDDILDFEGDKNNIGKPFNKDLKEGVFTLPLIYALEKDSGKLKRLLDKFPYSERNIKIITSLIEKSGGINRAKILAEKYTQRALREINRLPESENRIIFSEVAEKLLNRNK